MLDLKNLDSDRRRVALHEAAHAVLAHRFGGGARAYIWPNPSGGSLGERSWAGTCEIWALPGSFEPGPLAPSVIEPPPLALAHIGLAGAAAEIYDVCRDEVVVFFELQSLLEIDELSDTDKAFVGDQVSTELIESVITHIAKCWPTIVRLAGELAQFPEAVRPAWID